jgi:hypothetical protein
MDARRATYLTHSSSIILWNAFLFLVHIKIYFTPGKRRWKQGKVSIFCLKSLYFSRAKPDLFLLITELKIVSRREIQEEGLQEVILGKRWKDNTPTLQ